MKKIKYIGLYMLMLVFAACSSESALRNSEHELFPSRPDTPLEKSLQEIFGPYNAVVEYRYIENLIPKDWYYITAIKEELILEAAQFLHEYWVEPLEDGSSKEFVVRYFPRVIYLIGSPARNKDGTVVLGQAEGGTLIRFTEMNDLNVGNPEWIKFQMRTAFHEYAHLIHQNFGMPNEFRSVTPDSYTKNGWRAVSLSSARTRGMVSPYATSSVAEDFAELYCFYITETDEKLAEFFDDVTGQYELNQGRAILNKKLNIMNKYLKSVGMSLDDVRESFQTKING